MIAALIYGIVASVTADGWFTVACDPYALKTYDLPSYTFKATPYRQPIIGERVGLAVAPGGGVVCVRPNWVPKP